MLYCITFESMKSTCTKLEIDKLKERLSVTLTVYFWNLDPIKHVTEPLLHSNFQFSTVICFVEQNNSLIIDVIWPAFSDMLGLALLSYSNKAPGSNQVLSAFSLPVTLDIPPIYPLPVDSWDRLHMISCDSVLQRDKT